MRKLELGYSVWEKDLFTIIGKMVLGKSYTTGFIFLQIKNFKILQSTSLVSVCTSGLNGSRCNSNCFLLVFLFSVRFLTLWPRLSSRTASDLQ